MDALRSDGEAVRTVLRIARTAVPRELGPPHQGFQIAASDEFVRRIEKPADPASPPVRRKGVHLYGVSAYGTELGW